MESDFDRWSRQLIQQLGKENVSQTIEYLHELKHIHTPTRNISMTRPIEGTTATVCDHSGDEALDASGHLTRNGAAGRLTTWAICVAEAKMRRGHTLHTGKGRKCGPFVFQMDLVGPCPCCLSRGARREEVDKQLVDAFSLIVMHPM